MNKSKFDFNEFIKWFLPIALSFIGWYVSSTIAPLANDLEAAENKIAEQAVIIAKMESNREQCMGRMARAEQDIRKLKDDYIRHNILSEQHYDSEDHHHEHDK